MNKRSLISIVLTGCLAVMTAACGGAGSEAAGDDEPQKIIISVPGKSIALPSVWLAQAEGLFEERGVEVEIVTIQPGTDLAELGAGKVDLILSGVTAGVFNAVSSGLEITWVAPGYEVNPETGMGVYLKDEYFDAAGNLYPDKLAGAQIAITQSGGLQDHTILYAIKDSSVDYSDLNIQRLPNSDIFAAIVNGSLDGGFLTSPFYANLPPDSGYRLGMRPFTPSFVAYLAGPSTKGKDKELTKFFCAIKDVQAKYLQPGFTRNDESVALLSSVLGIEAETIRNDPAPNLFDADLNMDGAEGYVESLQGLLIEAGLTNYREPIPADKLIDRSYIEGSCD